MTWQQIGAGFVNTTLVFGLIWFWNNYVSDWVREKLPWIIPVLAGIAGPFVIAAQNAIAGWLGQPVDLSPWIGLFSGASAVAAHQVYKQLK